MLVAVVKSGIAFTVPPVVVTFDDNGGGTDEPGAVTELVDDAPPMTGAASTKAEGGSPPMVSASLALSAYGALTSSTRACSASPDTCTASQRAAPVINISGGRPWLPVVPSCTV